MSIKMAVPKPYTYYISSLVSTSVIISDLYTLQQVMRFKTIYIYIYIYKVSVKKKINKYVLINKKKKKS